MPGKSPAGSAKRRHGEDQGDATPSGTRRPVDLLAPLQRIRDRSAERADDHRRRRGARHGGAERPRGRTPRPTFATQTRRRLTDAFCGDASRKCGDLLGWGDRVFRGDAMGCGGHMGCGDPESCGDPRSFGGPIADVLGWGGRVSGFVIYRLWRSHGLRTSHWPRPAMGGSGHQRCADILGGGAPISGGGRTGRKVFPSSNRAETK